MARALGADPDILLMDEPFGAIDPIVRVRLQNELPRLQKVLHKTIVFVTHDIDEALRLASRIAVMDCGRLVQAGTPLELLTAPASDFVRDLIGRDDLGIRLLGLADGGKPAAGRRAGAGRAHRRRGQPAPGIVAHGGGRR